MAAARATTTFSIPYMDSPQSQKKSLLTTPIGGGGGGLAADVISG